MVEVVTVVVAISGEVEVILEEVVAILAVEEGISEVECILEGCTWVVRGFGPLRCIQEVSEGGDLRVPACMEWEVPRHCAWERPQACEVLHSQAERAWAAILFSVNTGCSMGGSGRPLAVPIWVCRGWALAMGTSDWRIVLE